MRPQIQLLDPHMIVDLARRGAREGLEMYLRRRRRGDRALCLSTRGPKRLKIKKMETSRVDGVRKVNGRRKETASIMSDVAVPANRSFK